MKLLATCSLIPFECEPPVPYDNCVGIQISCLLNAHFAQCLNSVLNVKALVGAFNQEKALAGAFSVITNLLIVFVLKLYFVPHDTCCSQHRSVAPSPAYFKQYLNSPRSLYLVAKSTARKKVYQILSKSLHIKSITIEQLSIFAQLDLQKSYC